jgi:uncharacterized protein YwgA
MTPEPEHVVADIVAAAGGRLVSRIRLQKLAYLLDQLGAKSGFRYAYHHYGPYSRDLDAAVSDAEAFGLLEEKYDRRKLDGARYSIFELKGDVASHEFSYLHEDGLRRIVQRLAPVHATVLELAATAHWLIANETIKDCRAEIVRRKGTKASEGRLAEATQMLAQLGLPPFAEQA